MAMRYRWILLLAALALCGARGQAGESRVVALHDVPQTTLPPVIDGSLDDACWEGVPAITGMVLRGVRSMPEVRTRATYQTRTTLLYDDEALYIGMRLDEPNPEGLRKSCVKYDGQIWWDDSVEVYIGPGTSHKSYFKFITNPIGTRHDVRGLDAGYYFTMPPWGTGTAWEVKARIGADHWSLEFRMPWSDFEVEPPKPGDMWMFEVVRFRYANTNITDRKKRHTEYSSWNPGAFYNRPDRYGNIVFSGTTASLETMLVEQVKPVFGGNITIYGRQGALQYVEYATLKETELAAAQRALKEVEASLTAVLPGLAKKRAASLEETLAGLRTELATIAAAEADAGTAERLAGLQDKVRGFAWLVRFHEKNAAIPAAEAGPDEAAGADGGAAEKEGEA